MGLLDRLFGGSKPAAPPASPKSPTTAKPTVAKAPSSHQLPSSMVAEGLGEVNVMEEDGKYQLDFTILMEPSDEAAEGWQTAVAMDASASMQGLYGRMLEGQLPAHVRADFKSKGLIQEESRDGERRLSVSQAAVDEGLRLGYFKRSTNEVEPVTRKFLAYLADKLDADGGSSLAYWACGPAGADLEEVGDFTSEQCQTLSVAGPQKFPFGNGTKLLPVVKWLASKFGKDTRAIAVVVTDGRCEDLEAVKAFTKTLAISISKKERAFVKLVLVGIGDQVDEAQMEELDDLDTGTDVDIWDHKIEKDMRALAEIFAELVDENTIVAPSAKIFSADGSIVKDFSDGLPAKVSFSMPISSAYFEIDIGGNRIRQVVKK